MKKPHNKTKREILHCESMQALSEKQSHHLWTYTFTHMPNACRRPVIPVDFHLLYWGCGRMKMWADGGGDNLSYNQSVGVTGENQPSALVVNSTKWSSSCLCTGFSCPQVSKIYWKNPQKTKTQFINNNKNPFTLSCGDEVDKSLKPKLKGVNMLCRIEVMW